VDLELYIRGMIIDGTLRMGATVVKELVVSTFCIVSDVAMVSWETMVLSRKSLVRTMAHVLFRSVCWESNPGPSEARTRACEKDCRSYDLQPVKGKELILCSHGMRGNAESHKKQISSSPHFFKII
jgi:hypothetical protein